MPTRCDGTSSRRASRGRRAACRTRASARRPQDALHAVERLLVLRDLRGPRRLDSRPDPTTTSARAPARPVDPQRARRLGAGGHRRRSTPSTRSLRRRASRRSSTTSRTGTCAAAGPRFWKSSDPQAHATLHRCLVTTTQLLAPLCPFLSDEIYVALTGELSVHTSDWPSRGPSDPAPRHRDASRAPPRHRRSRRPRRGEGEGPPATAARAAAASRASSSPTSGRAEIADELNVKALDDIDSLSGLVSWTVVPNFRALGPRLGAKVNDVKAALVRSRRRRAASRARA